MEATMDTDSLKILECAKAVSQADPEVLSAADAATVRYILSFRYLTDFQIHALWQIMVKYPTSLLALGIRAEDLVPPAGPPPREVKKARKKVRLALTGSHIAALIPYDKELIEICKEIPGRRYDKTGSLTGHPHAWAFPATAIDIETALKIFETAGVNVECGAGIEGVLERGKVSYVESRATDAQISVPTKIDLYPFQQAGVKWISDRGGRALVGDEMGVGKSCQALGWLLVSKELPALVLCPANLRVNWLREAEKFTGLKCLILSSKSSLAAFKRQGLEASLKPEAGYDLVIGNYDLLSGGGALLGELAEFGFKTLICDEAHYLKEQSSRRSKAVLELSKKIKNVIGLTGTPILNRTKEVWHLTQIVDSALFPKFHDFGIRYCGAFKSRWGWQYDGASNLEELDKKLRSTVMIRRTKEQVLTELPPKTRVLTPFVLDSAEEKTYRKASQEAMDRLVSLQKEKEEWRTLQGSVSSEEFKGQLEASALKKARGAKLAGLMLEELSKIRQICVDAKYDQCLAFILNLHAQEKKILVFASHHSTIDRLLADLRGAGIKTDRIDGRVESADRDAIKESFQTGDLEVLVCGIRAAGEGLTLTASSTVVFMELDFTPGRMVQAEDRTHRIGQERPVTIYYLVLMGSIEEKIAKLVDSKRAVANSALGEGERTVSETGILDSMINEILEGKNESQTA